MQCFTVVGHDVLAGVQVVRAPRPFIQIGTDRVINFSDELSERFFACYRDRIVDETLVYDQTIGEVFLRRASIELCKDGLMRVVTEVGADSAKRALVLIDQTMLGLGIDNDHFCVFFSLSPSLEIRASVWRMMVKDLKCAHPINDPAIRRVQLCTIMEAGNTVDLDVAPYKFDARRMWRRADDTRTRPILRIKYDGHQFSVLDQRLIPPSALEVVETF
jgi:hypothetical protein